MDLRDSTQEKGLEARAAEVGCVSRGQKKVHLRFIDGAWPADK